VSRIVNQLLALPGFAMLTCRHAQFILKPIHFALHLVDLYVELSYNTFGKMGPFGQLIFDLLMDIKLLLQRGYLLLELFIFEDELLRLF
jgi:hypothetical protein